MKKTQKTFKKKYIVYGMMAFAGVALVSTGFATWVLAQDVSASGTGNVTVGSVTEGNLGLDLDKLSDSNFRFEPESSDTSGRVRYDGTNAAQLSLKFTGKVSNCQYLDNVSVQMTVSDGVLQAAGYKQDDNASSGYITSKDSHKWVVDESSDAKHYITLPECVKSSVTLTVLTTQGEIAPSGDGINAAADSVTSGDIRNFQYTVTFGWGTTFGEMNPGKYYDDDATGKTISYKDMKNELDNFHKLVGDATADSKTSSYDVVFTAHNN